MKPVLVVLALAALAGCATQDPNYYNARITDPNGWQTVSVTPVPYGTGAHMAAAGDPPATAVAAQAPASATSYAAPAYVPAPTTTVVTQPVYVYPPVYAAAPVYAAPAPSPYYWWPPISIGLGFSWSHWSGGGCCHGGWHGGHGGGGWHHR